MKTIIICGLIMLLAFIFGIGLVIYDMKFEGVFLIIIASIGLSAAVLAGTHNEHSSKL